MSDENDKPETVTSDGKFPDTRWSLIVSARAEDSIMVTRALQELCQLYWLPVYCYIRRRGSSAVDAEDLTQGFFAQFLRRDDFATASQEKGKLRSYLLKSVSHYLSDEFDKRTAQKRGGGQTVISIDQAAAEEHYQSQLEPRDEVSPDILFEKRWAVTLLENVLASLRETYDKQGKLKLFERLQPYLSGSTGTGEAALSTVASELQMGESAVRVALFRIRRRYGDALRQAILETVVDPAEVDGEIDYLFSVITQ